MKKFKHFAYVGAIALLGMVGFTACSSNDETALDPTPSYEGESVKTQFTISLPENIKMRQAASTVQQGDGTFRGIDGIKLVPYSLGNDAASGVQSTSSANAPLISLSAINAFDNETSHSKVYANVNLAVGTSNFLFYGKALDNKAETAITTAADKFKFGTLSVAGLSGTPTLDNVSFTPVSIYTAAGIDEKGTNLIAILNAIADAAPTVDLSTGDNKKPKFKEITEEQSPTIYELWNQFKELNTGSSANVEWAIGELFKNLDGLVTDAAKTTVPDGYKMAMAIRNVYKTYCDSSITSGVTTSLTLKEAYQGYPANVNLPEGAARVAYSSGAFAAVTADVAYAASMNVATLDKYVYPANLQYYVNSPVKVASTVMSPQYGTKNWAQILALYTGTDNMEVGADTRSVAITNPVQYGVARLDATIAGLSGDDTYKDHDGHDVNVDEGFTLTGILIGGQKSVGWNYIPKGETAYTIYDKTMAAASASMTVKKGSANSAVNYTLVLQTGDQDAADKTVNVALEFVNNGDDFKGARGEIIPAGATFYLVGALNTENASNKTDASVADAKDRVFTQDFNTKATFSIKLGTNNDPDDEDTQEGLGTATKGLPDLRSTQMELGLSVDLEWQPGLNFNVDI